MRWLLLAVIGGADDCPGKLTKWLYDVESGVNVGSTWLTLGGNASAHAAAVRCVLRRAAEAAVAPPIDHTLVEVSCVEAACGQDLAVQIADFLRARAGRYGVVVVARADEAPLWVLKLVAAYYWGKDRCAHAAFLEPVDCSRIAWFLSTSLGADALYDEDARASESLDALVASQTRELWPSLEAGSLAVKAPRVDRCVFVRGQTPASLVAAIAAAHLADRSKVDIPIMDVETWLQSRFVGQPGAVAAVARKVRAIRDGVVASRAGPAVFYFYGVAGVGKTRLAELMAEALDRPRIVLEMESYSSEEDANRLFGAPPGYGQGYCLVDELLKRPRAVVVFDEIEKAHPSIFREKLHSALSAGVMRHKRDRTKVATLRDVVFVFTTNCFEAEVVRLAGECDYDCVRDAMAARINDSPRLVCSETRPTTPFDDASLRSRVPRTAQFPFLPLAPADIKRLISIELGRLAQQTPAFVPPFELSWSSRVPEVYAEHGTDARAA